MVNKLSLFSALISTLPKTHAAETDSDISVVEVLQNNLTLQIIVTVVLFILACDFILNTGIICHVIRTLFSHKKRRTFLFISIYSLTARLSILPTLLIFNPWPLFPKETQEHLVQFAYYFMYFHFAMNAVYQRASIFSSLYFTFTVG